MHLWSDTSISIQTLIWPTNQTSTAPNSSQTVLLVQVEATFSVTINTLDVAIEIKAMVGKLSVELDKKLAYKVRTIDWLWHTRMICWMQTVLSLHLVLMSRPSHTAGLWSWGASFCQSKRWSGSCHDRWNSKCSKSYVFMLWAPFCLCLGSVCKPTSTWLNVPELDFNMALFVSYCSYGSRLGAWWTPTFRWCLCRWGT